MVAGADLFGGATGTPVVSLLSETGYGIVYAK